MPNSLQEFLDVIFTHKEEKDFIELRFFNPKKICTDQVWFSTVSEVVSYVEANKYGKNCYFGLSPRTAKKGTADTVADVSLLYADLDFDKVSEDQARENILKLGLPPTTLVASGHGLQCTWLLKRAYPFQELKPILIRLLKYLDADILKDNSRIFRVPTSQNCKRKPWVPCEILSLNKKQYSLEEIKVTLNKQSIPLENDVETPGPLKLPEEFSLLGFKRQEGRWESGVCPKCGNSGLFIYDNNPRMVSCSHSGSCNFTSSTTELRDIIIRQQKQQEAAFDAKQFITSIKNQPPALKIGYPKLDKIYKFRLGTFNLIAARLGVGKSTFAYNMLLNCAEAYPESFFVFFTYEVPKDLLYVRLLTIEYAKASKQSVSFEEMTQEIKNGGHKAALAMKRLERLNNILIFDSPATTLEELQKIVLSVKSVGCVWIDYLEKVRVDRPVGSEELRVSTISTTLTNFAIEQKEFPIIALSQINREVKGRLDPRPQENDIRYSDRPMQDSCVALGLYNPSQNKKLGSKKNAEEEDITEEDSEEEETKPITKLEVIGLKNRFGSRSRTITVFNQVSGHIQELKRDFPIERRSLPQEKEEEVAPPPPKKRPYVKKVVEPTPLITKPPKREVHLHKPLTYRKVED